MISDRASSAVVLQFSRAAIDLFAAFRRMAPDHPRLYALGQTSGRDALVARQTPTHVEGQFKEHDGRRRDG